MASNLMQIPEMQQVQIYFDLGNKYLYSNQIIAYYLKSYGIQKSMEVYKKYCQDPQYIQALKYQTNLWFTEIENLKSQLSGQLPKNQTEEKNFIENFANNIFAQTEEEFAKGRNLQQCAQNYELFTRLTEVLSQYGQISTELNEMKKNAKLKAYQLQQNASQLPQQYNYNQQQQQQPSVFRQQMQLNQNVSIYDQNSVNRILQFVNKSQLQQQQQQQNYQQPVITPQPSQQQQQQQQQQQPQQYGQKSQTPFQQQNITMQQPIVQQQNQFQQQQQQQQQVKQQNVVQTSSQNYNYGNLQQMSKQEQQLEAKKLIEYAISELDFKNSKQAQEDLMIALKIIKQLQ